MTDIQEENTDIQEEDTDILEEKPKIKRQQRPLTEDEKDKRRKALEKARNFKVQNKIELKKYRDKDEKPPTGAHAVIVEKPLKQKRQVIKEIIKYETESESEEEIVERIVIKKKPREPKEVSKNDMVNLTYREKLQQTLKDEKMRMIYSSLFDY